MKKKKLLVLLVLGLSLNSFGQSRDGSGGSFSDWVGTNYLNHAKGVKLLSFKVGGTKYSNWGYFAPGFDYFLSDKLALKTELVFDKGEIGRTTYTDMTFNPGVSFTAYELKNRHFFNINGGLRAGMQKTFNEPYDITKWNFVYGPSLGVEAESYFGKLGLTAQFQQFYTLGTDFGSFHYNATLGLKFIL